MQQMRKVTITRLEPTIFCNHVLVNKKAVLRFNVCLWNHEESSLSIEYFFTKTWTILFKKKFWAQQCYNILLSRLKWKIKNFNLFLNLFIDADMRFLTYTPGERWTPNEDKETNSLSLQYEGKMSLKQYIPWVFRETELFFYEYS